MDFEDHFLDDDDENEQLSLRVEDSAEDSTQNTAVETKEKSTDLEAQVLLAGSGNASMVAGGSSTNEDRYVAYLKG